VSGAASIYSGRPGQLHGLGNQRRIIKGHFIGHRESARCLSDTAPDTPVSSFPLFLPALRSSNPSFTLRSHSSACAPTPDLCCQQGFGLGG
jgi:hypothetical protein